MFVDSLNNRLRFIYDQSKKGLISDVKLYSDFALLIVSK